MAKQGYSPVFEVNISAVSIQSSTGHEKPGVKIGGPSPKAKYDQVTDSEQVL